MLRRAIVVGCLIGSFTNASALAQTCTPFTDLPASSPFCGDVQWMYNRGITLGCTSTTYCPNDNVTRLQMAAFMHRLGNVTFQQGGNAFGTTGVLGVTDAPALVLLARGERAQRFERADSAGDGPDLLNIEAGHPDNRVARNCPTVNACLGSESPLGGSVLGGGTAEQPNRVTDSFATVVGGWGNRAGNDDSNSTNALGAFVGGGVLNHAAGVAATVAGGSGNLASGVSAAIAGGADNIASGEWSTVPGGGGNIADGSFSFAAGSRAHSLAQGCFTWADTSTSTPYQCTGVDAFTARASGGVYFRTNPSATAGVDLFGGASAWSAASDRALKENVVDVDASDILRRLVAMPIASWNYRAQDRAIRHVGPMAQDFHGAFGLGESDRHISTIDADGVALAAIQGLNAKLERMLRASDARIAELERQAGDLASLRAELAAVTRTVAELRRERAALARR